MRLSVTSRRLHPRHVFRISRAERRFVENVFLCVERDGVRGFGEASPNAFYHETAADVAAKLASLEPFLATLSLDSPADIAAAWSEAWPLLAPSRAAQCALDLALWDWLAKRRGVSVCELALGSAARPVRSFCTIGLAEPAEFAAKLAEVRDFAAIKLKSNAAADLSFVREARARSTALLAVDANCAWHADALPARAAELRALDVAFLEQPFLPAEDALLRPGVLPLPVLADESCVTEADVLRVLGHFDGFNVKLVKCGGLTPALRMVEQGAGRPTMIGCMLESSLLIAAGLVAAQRTTYADLDGAWLLADDPFTGLAFDKGWLNPSELPGFGVAPKGGAPQEEFL